MQGGANRLKWLARRIAPVPQLRDPADAIAASLVAGSIAVLVVAVLLFVILLVVTGQGRPIHAATLPLGLLLLLGVREALRRGHVRSSAYVLCGFGVLFNAADLLPNGPNTLALGGFLIIVVLGGLTIGPRGALAITAFAVAVLAPVLLGWVDGNFSRPSSQERLLHYAVQLSLGGFLAGWWALRTRRLLADLRRSEARWSLLLEASPDAIASTDAAGLMTFQNRTSEEMLGYPASEVVGRPWTDVPTVDPADLPRLHEHFASAVKLGVSAPPAELTLHHKDGRAVEVELKGVPLYEDGAITGTVTIMRDITARKVAELERASLQRQLAGAQRMEALGLVAGGVAHDFNNVLAIVLAAAETRDPTAFDDIRDAARRGAALTRQLLAFSGRKGSDPRPTDVNGAVTAIRPILARILGGEAAVGVRLSDELPAVVVDPGQLDQILVNLAANARDAMPNGGTLTISTGAAGGLVELRVADTGVGMDAATLAKAFEPFFTTKGERGTGLGLAVVEGIVRGAGGTIRCDSEPARGTTFTVAFPASSEAAVVAVCGPPERATASRRLVLVDDDPAVRRSVRRLLERGGFVVDAFDGGQDVAEIEARLRDAYGLVTDLVMPGKTGVDLALELRGRGVTLPILFVSGYAEHALLARIREVSRSSLLEKPFGLDDVVKRLALLASS